MLMKIHAVGRTGSGKVKLAIVVLERGVLTRLQSSLTLALLRCIFTEGNVRFDGLPTEKINLDALRSSVTIIPQVVCVSPLSGCLSRRPNPSVPAGVANGHSSRESRSILTARRSHIKRSTTLRRPFLPLPWRSLVSLDRSHPNSL